MTEDLKLKGREPKKKQRQATAPKEYRVIYAEQGVAFLRAVTGLSLDKARELKIKLETTKKLRSTPEIDQMRG
jgi:hypothetical protein